MSTATTTTIALLIDAENTSPQHMDMVMNYLKNIGDVVIRRAYANWGKSNMQSWRDAVIYHGLTTIQQFDHLSGKNSSDIAISIDAMDLLYSKNIHIFCLVSSDSDFTPLCLRLREHGKKVIGMGGMNSSKSLVNACTEYKFFVKETSLPEIVKAPVVQSSSKTKPDPNKDKELINLLHRVINEKQVGGLVNIAVIGTEIRNHPKINIEKYGYSKISDLMRVLNDFEVILQGTSTLMVKKRKQSQHHDDYNTTKVNILDGQSGEVLLKDIGLTNAISNAIVLYQKEGWADINQVANHVKDTYGIVSTQYGYANMEELLKNLTLFRLKKEQGVVLVCDTRLDNEENGKTEEVLVTKLSKKELQQQVDLISAIDSAIAKHQENAGWARLTNVGTELKEQGFQAKQYGYKTLSEMLKVIGWFEMKNQDNVSYVKDPMAKPVKKMQNLSQLDASVDNEHTKALSKPSTQEVEDLTTSITETNNLSDDEPIVTIENIEEQADEGQTATLEVMDFEIASPEICHDNHDETVPKIADVIEEQTISQVVPNSHQPEKNQQQSSEQPKDVLDELIDVLQQIDNEVVLENETTDDVNLENDEENSTIYLENLITVINEAIISNQRADGWTSVSNVSTQVRKQLGFGSQSLGYRTFADLIADLSGYEMQKKGRIWLVKMVENKPQKQEN